MPKNESTQDRDIRLARYHLRVALYLQWLNDIFPDGLPDGWKAPRPLWANPNGAPAYLTALEQAAIDRDRMSRRQGLPSLVAVCSIDQLNDDDATPTTLNASVVLFTDSMGMVIEAACACDEPTDNQPLIIHFPAELHLDFQVE